MKHRTISSGDLFIVRTFHLVAPHFVRWILAGFLSLGAAVPLCAEPGPVVTVAADLNGDGSTEQVTLIPSGGSIPGKLRVAKTEMELIHEEGPAEIRIVDVSRKDGQKEIEVRCHGPSDHSYSVIFGYDGTRIKRLGEVGSEPEFPGSGVVFGNSWTGSFTIRHSFVLDHSRKLIEVLQPMYYVNRSFKAESEFPIQHSMNDVATVTNIDEGSDILVVAVAYQPVKQATSQPGKVSTSLREWYLIKSQSGLMGWAGGETLRKHVTIPAAG